MTEEDIHLLLWDSLQDLLSGTSQGANECSAPLFGEKKKKKEGDVSPVLPSSYKHT